LPRSECSNDDRLSPPCDTPWRMKPHYKNRATPRPPWLRNGGRVTKALVNRSENSISYNLLTKPLHKPYW
jgi:hypothetical protein